MAGIELDSSALVESVTELWSSGEMSGIELDGVALGYSGTEVYSSGDTRCSQR